jgi:hypothetical protein
MVYEPRLRLRFRPAQVDLICRKARAFEWELVGNPIRRYLKWSRGASAGLIKTFHLKLMKWSVSPSKPTQWTLFVSVEASPTHSTRGLKLFSTLETFDDDSGNNNRREARIYSSPLTETLFKCKPQFGVCGLNMGFVVCVHCRYRQELLSRT